MSEYKLPHTAAEIEAALKNALNPDPTLSESGKPADACAVKEAIQQGINEQTVRFCASQSLSEAQKEQARKNIGAGNVSSVNGKTPDASGNVDVSADVKDGVSATHAWKGTVLTITSASGTSSADLKGDPGQPGSPGEPGADGYTPIKNVDYFDGKDGVSATHTWDGTILTITSASGTTSANLKGEKGDPGKDGTTPVKGVDYHDGQPGTDGKSATHSWNGTVLSVTSASGTSSADLKGDPGRDGTSVTVSEVVESTASGGTNVVTFSDGKKINIKNGVNGTNGTSVTVTNISQSDTDGGSNVITFSDGKTITVKNGSKGSNGKDGVSATHTWNGTTLSITSASGTSSADLKGPKGDSGEDYVLTTEDKEEIAEQAASMVNIPQADWNAKEGYIGHILNRTHYVTLGADTETVVEFMEATPTQYATKFEIPVDFQLDLERYYLVVYNGVAYKMYPNDMYDEEGNVIPVLGDFGSDAKYPFFIFPPTHGDLGSVMTNDGATSVYVGIYAYTEKVKKLHKKYLPDETLYIGKELTVEQQTAAQEMLGIGDLNAALDSILAMQEALIGGESA